jgi:hypothetical protein
MADKDKININDDKEDLISGLRDIVADHRKSKQNKDDKVPPPGPPADVDPPEDNGPKKKGFFEMLFGD